MKLSTYAGAPYFKKRVSGKSTAAPGWLVPLLPSIPNFRRAPLPTQPPTIVAHLLPPLRQRASRLPPPTRLTKLGTAIPQLWRPSLGSKSLPSSSSPRSALAGTDCPRAHSIALGKVLPVPLRWEKPAGEKAGIARSRGGGGRVPERAHRE
jgi:hypothetical protein